MKNIPATQNTEFGFYGTMDEHAEAAWGIAMKRIAKATGKDHEAIRVFLDSRHGRHFADDVQNNLFDGMSLDMAIARAVKSWMEWTANKEATAEEYCVEAGTPLLIAMIG